jgi:hypothetical protein
MGGAPSPPEVAQPTPPSAPKSSASGSSRLFLELLTMIAGQAELLLVGAEGLPAQPDEARRLIDYLAVLEEKTKGNLSADEARALSSVVFQLRTFFLQRK